MIRALKDLRRAVGRYRGYWSIRTHGSRLGRPAAGRHSEYLERSRRSFAGPRPEPDGVVALAVDEFQAKRSATFRTDETARLAGSMFARVREREAAGEPIWDADMRYSGDIYKSFSEVEALFRGPLGTFLTAHYGAYFKIWYGIMYKSENHGDAPSGSQLWHSDGGPGTCINVMFYLHEVTKADGAMEALPWSETLAVYRDEVLGREPERRIARAARDRTLTPADERAILCEWYREEIERRFADRVAQPTGGGGIVFPFSNNILHKGGYPERGHTRYVCVFHCYPSHEPTRFEAYRAEGIPKRGSYPKDPAARF